LGILIDILQCVAIIYLADAVKNLVQSQTEVIETLEEEKSGEKARTQQQ